MLRADQITPAAHTAVCDLSQPGWGDELGLHDLVLAGLTAVEFTRAHGDEAARGAAIAAFLREAMRRVADDGALVVIEPGSRAESRALHVARSIMLAEGATVFAPCLHALECPMLRTTGATKTSRTWRSRRGFRAWRRPRGCAGRGSPGRTWCCAGTGARCAARCLPRRR